MSLSREQVERLREGSLDVPGLRDVVALCEGWLAQQDALEAADRECGEAWTAYNDSETARFAAEARVAAQQQVIDAAAELLAAVDSVCDYDAANEALPAHARSVLEYPLPALRAALLSINEEPTVEEIDYLYSAEGNA